VLFDSGSKNSNWISRNIAIGCEAQIERLPAPINFVVTNGGRLVAREFVTLNFRNIYGETNRTYCATFYIHDKPAFCDAIVGQSYMVSSGMTQGVVFGTYQSEQSQCKFSLDIPLFPFK
jgi:hypothetical protein